MVMMSDKLKDRVRTSFTSWKLDVINAAAMDRKLKPASVRMLIRLVEALDQRKWDQDARTCEAYISDNVFCDEIPGFKDPGTPAEHREKLRAAGWLRYESGSGRIATRYFLTDKPVNEILDDRIELREKRELRRIEQRVKDEEKRQARRQRKSSPEETSPKTRFEPLGNMGENPDVSPPVHLRDSPGKFSLRSEDMALEAHASEIGEVVCCECGMMPAPYRHDGFDHCEKHLPDDRDDIEGVYPP